MKKLAYVLFCSTFLVFGCSDEEEPDKVETPVVTDDEPTQQEQPPEETLQIVKTYSEEIGDLEAFYINDQVDETISNDNLDLTINSIEYGKVLVNEENRDMTANLAGADGKVTYIKAGVEISGDEQQLSAHNFYVYQSDIRLPSGSTTQADTIFSDHVALDSTKTAPVTTGYLYYLVNDTLPLESATITVPAPFTPANSTSISDNYVFELEFE